MRLRVFPGPQELDPLNLTAGTSVGAAYFYLGQYDKAIEEQRKTLELNPGFSMALVNLGEVYEAKAMYADAITVHDKPGALASLGHAYAASGRKAEARKILRELNRQSKHRYVSPYDRALIYTGLGENDQALAWLEKAEEQNVPLHQNKCRPEIQFPSLRQALSAIAATHRLPTLERRQEQTSSPSKFWGRELVPAIRNPFWPSVRH